MECEIYKCIYISIWMKLELNYIWELRRWNLRYTLYLCIIYINCIVTHHLELDHELIPHHKLIES